MRCRMPRIEGGSRRVALLLALILLCVASPLRAQPRNPLLSKDMPPELQAMMAEMQGVFEAMADSDRRTLERCIALFRDTAPADADWVSILDGLTLETPPMPIGLDGTLGEANARASISRERPHVKVDQLMFLRIKDRTRAAARRLVAEIAMMPETDVPVGVARNIGVEMAGSVVGWMIAHEIAHHRLGHECTPRPRCAAPDYRTSRERELAADRSSFEMLNAAGFSLFQVQHFLRLLADVEALQRRYGKGRVERLSSHPDWARRFAAIGQYMRSNNVDTTAEQWMLYSTILPAKGRGSLERVLLAIPKDANAHVGFIMREEQLHAVGVEDTSKIAVRVYDREDQRVYVLDNLGGHTTTGEMRVEPPRIDDRTTSLVYYRDSFIGIAMTDASDRILQSLRHDPRGHEAQVLTGLTANETRRAQARALLDERYTVIHDLQLRHLKSEISVLELQGQLEDTRRRFAARFDALLGVGALERVDRATIKAAQRLANVVGGSAKPRRFAPPGLGFSIDMPGIAQKQSFDVSGTQVVLYQSIAADGIFVISRADQRAILPAAISAQRQRQELAAARDGAVASAGGVLLRDREHTFRGRPARDFTIEVKAQGMRVESRLVSLGRMYLHLMVQHESSMHLDDQTKQFFESLELSP